MNKCRIFATVVLLLLSASGAHALIVNVSATADNTLGGGLCADASCNANTGWSAFGAAPNGNWTSAQSWSLDLSAGTHWFVFDVTNSRPPSSGNPAALLAEINWGSNVSYSSSAWEVATGPGTWAAATEWGANGGANIWTDVNGGAVAGISSNANWILGADNFNDAPEFSRLRTGITIQPIMEPGTLALFAIGLVGLVSARRRV